MNRSRLELKDEHFNSYFNSTKILDVVIIQSPGLVLNCISKIPTFKAYRFIN